MFFKRAENVKPWMRPTYLALSALLGLFISVGAHALVELWWLSYAPAHGIAISWTSVLGKGQCALPVWLQIGLPIIGIIGGYLTGRIWWRLVYVERRWSK